MTAAEGQPARPAAVAAPAATALGLRAELDAGEVLRKNGRFKEAVARFQPIVDADAANLLAGILDDSDVIRAYIGLARSQVALAEYDAADKVLQVAAAKWSDPEIHARRGYLLDDLGRHDEAVREYLQAEPAYEKLVASATNPDVFRQYARVLDGLGRSDAKEQFKLAKTAYESAGVLTSDDPDMLSNYAFVLDELDKHDEAVAAYDRVIARRPDDYIALFNKAVVLDNLGNFPAAEEAYRAALERYPDDPDCNAGRGYVLGKLERYVEAESFSRKALEKDKTNANAYLGLGYALEHLGRQQEAEQAYRASLSLDPTEPDTLSNLAHLLTDRDRPEEAQLLIAQALAVKRTWQFLNTLATIEVLLADKYHDDDLYREAIDNVREAHKMLPTRIREQERDSAAQLELNLASAHVSLGEYSFAKAAWRRAQMVARPNSSAQLKAGRNLRRLNDYLRRTVSVPRWLAWPVSALAVLGILYGLAFQQLRLDSAGFVGFVLGMLFVIFAAFSLPAITRLKIGPAEFEKGSGIPTLPNFDKS